MTCCDALHEHRILFSSMWHLPRLSQLRTQRRPKSALGWLQKLTHDPLAIATLLVCNLFRSFDSAMDQHCTFPVTWVIEWLTQCDWYNAAWLWVTWKIRRNFRRDFVLSLNCLFLRASAMLKHVIAIGLTSVRPSVRHTLAPYQNGWIYRHDFFTTR